MRYLLLACLVVGLAPVWAEAGSRDSKFRISVGFGYSEGHYYGHRSHRGDYFDARFSYSEGYRDRHRSHVSYRPPRVHVRERYQYRAPVIYRPTVIYQAPPVVYQSPPVVYPSYRSYDCYPNYGSYYRSSTYYYGY